MPIIRQMVLTLSLIALGISYQGVSLALNCPPQPSQISKDFEGEIITDVAKIGPVSGAGLKIKAKQTARDLFEKSSERDRVYLEQMMYATYCSSLEDNKTLSKDEISRNIRDYNAVVRRTIQAQQAAVVSPKQPANKKASDTQQAETKQQSQSPVPPNPNISQHSAGANSPNIIGDRNIIITPPSDAKLDEVLDILRQKGEAYNPVSLLKKYPLGFMIFELDYPMSVIPYKTLSEISDYDIDWTVVKISHNTNDRIALRLPDLKLKDGTAAFTGAETGGPKKVGNLGCAGINGLYACGEILALKDNGVVFLVSLERFPVLPNK